jgi:hypothetical protein
MIQTVRLDANDFIGTIWEEMIWKKIKEAKEACVNEFKICFAVSDGGSDMIEKVATAAQKHFEDLQLKTTIKPWDKCKNEHVFLDVFNEKQDTKIRSYRFASRGDAPGNIIGAFNFLVEHHKFVQEKQHENITPGKKQKRNDSIDYDYNKK